MALPWLPPDRPHLRLSLSSTTMKRCIAMALLVCSSTSVVLSHRSSFAQQDESEVARKVLSKVAPTYPDLARKTNIHGTVKLGSSLRPMAG
jgi:hypothetical protein